MTQALALVPAQSLVALPTIDEERIRNRIVKARTRLMRDHVWYGNLTLRLRAVLEYRIPSMSATDGTFMYFNPLLLTMLDADDDDYLTSCAHETLHAALLHIYRWAGRDVTLANIAADMVVNEQLEKSKFKLLPSDWRDTRFDGMYFEQVYAILEKEQREGKPQPKHEKGPHDNMCVLMHAPDSDGGSTDKNDGDEPNPNESPDEQPNAGKQSVSYMTATDWQIAVEEASMTARKAGTMPAGLDTYMKGARESKSDWRAELREFTNYVSPRDFSWATPNRTYLGLGLILPGLKKEDTPKIGVGIDTSGSIDPDLLNIFGEEVRAIQKETRPEEIEIAYCDTKVNNVETFLPDDDMEFHPKGRGGTAFQPVFDHFNSADTPPTCLLFFTDMQCYDKPQEPDYPVMFVVPEEDTNYEVPFGRKIVISRY